MAMDALLTLSSGASTCLCCLFAAVVRSASRSALPVSQFVLVSLVWPEVPTWLCPHFVVSLIWPEVALRCEAAFFLASVAAGVCVPPPLFTSGTRTQQAASVCGAGGGGLYLGVRQHAAGQQGACTIGRDAPFPLRQILPPFIQVVRACLERGVLAPFLGAFDRVEREVRMGKDSRVDFVLHGPGALRKVFLEVKSVTLVDRSEGLEEGQGDPGVHALSSYVLCWSFPFLSH